MTEIIAFMVGYIFGVAMLAAAFILGGRLRGARGDAAYGETGFTLRRPRSPKPPPTVLDDAYEADLEDQLRQERGTP